MMRMCLLSSAAALGCLVSAQNVSRNLTCAWGELNDPRCDSPEYKGPYPECTLFQWPDGSQIPCQGLIHGDECEFTGSHAGSEPPPPASYHIHVLFPNAECTNCSSDFVVERPGLSIDGAMSLRSKIAAMLNNLTEEILGRPLADPIDVIRAAEDVYYNQCIGYDIIEPSPANYQTESCIFGVDLDKVDGSPFASPSTGLAYPNYAFLVPGNFWVPGLADKAMAWLEELKGGVYGDYTVLMHPNTGCNIRDHTEEGKSARWLGKPHPLTTSTFACNALGCNGDCEWGDPQRGPTQPQPLPANCSWSSAAWTPSSVMFP